MADIRAILSSSIDPADPTPAYHQVAAVLRWEVARGRIPIGTQLPPIRVLAAALELNYHTVRRAWGELETDGVITQRRGRGARVARAPAADSLTGWRPTAMASGARAGPPVVWVVDTSLERAARLAARLAGRWRVTAVPFPAEGPAPPPGPILALSGAAVASAWAGREGDLHLLEPVLDQATVTVIRRNAARLGTKSVTLIAGTGDPRQEASELLRQLPRLGLRTDLVEAIPDPAEGLAAIFPDAWQRLPWEERTRPDRMPVEFDWAPGPLARVAKQLGWQSGNG